MRRRVPIRGRGASSDYFCAADGRITATTPTDIVSSLPGAFVRTASMAEILHTPSIGLVLSNSDTMSHCRVGMKAFKSQPLNLTAAGAYLSLASISTRCAASLLS